VFACYKQKCKLAHPAVHYTVSQKIHATLVLGITLANVDQFTKSFTVGFCSKFAWRHLLYFPPYLKHITTLHRKTSAAETFAGAPPRTHPESLAGEEGMSRPPKHPPRSRPSGIAVPCSTEPHWEFCAVHALDWHCRI